MQEALTGSYCVPYAVLKAMGALVNKACALPFWSFQVRGRGKIILILILTIAGGFSSG